MNESVLRLAAKQIRVDYGNRYERGHVSRREADYNLAVADWLERSAYLWEYGDIGTANKEHALVVARAYLGEAS